MHSSVRLVMFRKSIRFYSPSVLWSRRFCHTHGSSETPSEKVLHQPVMLNEVLSSLCPKEGQTILDMTFGAGGHTTSILKQAPNIKVLALDRDPAAYSIAQHLSYCGGYNIQPLLGKFSECENLLLSVGVQPGEIDGVLIDAGCSSMQFDRPERGFSLSKDGPLDMRMDAHRYPDMPTAADVVNALDQQALASILKTYGEEKHAKKIASAIVQARSIYPITRTQQLASIVAGVCLYNRKDLLQRPAHVATKTFQSLRIFVNDELNELYAGLQTAQKFLKPGGRLVAISFHSLEDRIVKRFLCGIPMDEKPNLSARQRIRQGHRDFIKVDDDEQFTSPESNVAWQILQRKVLTPDQQDVLENPRGRSAKLRTAIKL
ncbi:12S rRNA N4-methylcytidine (m4C) methyltransferase isoform X1 [Hyla sarda]|uniref:12S rRNA N4-methylcytidine (m4C) methyltransferase isoform X1 n=1 Tax=Hyla sarda TaxID=327740 RepID=UPI0024C3D885|nr:12S rRNA N4-methylcytidine (m4C) methyltransferase isoform X1 [Hyla sarda]XP_056382656.1 12S rRNA N4-methylcytidine (m4C) methyltransferase isoform X1 [Hyla sarda]XP_056382658.1 12S rRNA N4-methylcytidine (m4C) methyltransferase isoform X1 [Hyla sarda]